jgi:hypothetical protein
MPGEGCVSVSNEDQPCACRLDLLFDAAQLRRLLFAEQSSVMTEPDQDHGSSLEDRAQGDLAALEVEHHTLSKTAVACCQHRQWFLGSDWLLCLAGTDLIPASRVY